MQGLTETGGSAQTKSVPSTHLPARATKRYAHTLAAITLPALVAGLFTAALFHDPRRADRQPEMNLAQRADIIRNAQVRTSTVHAPISDLRTLTR